MEKEYNYNPKWNKNDKNLNSHSEKKNAGESPSIDTSIELEQSHVVGSDILELKIRLLKNPFAITGWSALIVFIDLSGLGLLRSGSLTRITKLINSYVAIAFCYFFHKQKSLLIITPLASAFS